VVRGSKGGPQAQSVNCAYGEPLVHFLGEHTAEKQFGFDELVGAQDRLFGWDIDLLDSGCADGIDGARPDDAGNFAPGESA
jgi:hypothetical protein